MNEIMINIKVIMPVITTPPPWLACWLGKWEYYRDGKDENYRHKILIFWGKRYITETIFSPMPPRHPNCRCGIIPTINEKTIMKPSKAIFNLYWRIRWRLYDRKFKRYYRVGRQS